MLGSKNVVPASPRVARTLAPPPPLMPLGLWPPDLMLGMPDTSDGWLVDRGCARRQHDGPLFAAIRYEARRLSRHCNEMMLPPPPGF